MSNGSGDDSATVNHSGHCKIHTSIQIKRRKRNGEWSQLMKECPLCSADDVDSEWSSKSGSPRASRASPKRLQQQHGSNKRPTVPLTPSRFKECKDDEPSPGAGIVESPTSINGCIAVDDETTTEGSEESSSVKCEPYDIGSLRQKELKNRIISGALPPLPLLTGKEAMRMTTATTAKDTEKKKIDLMEHSPACASSLELLIQERKEKIRELKIRRLVPPSQRYQNYNGGGANQKVFPPETSRSARSTAKGQMGGFSTTTDRGGQNMASKPIGNLTIDEGKIDKKWDRSFHSAATEQMGNVSTDDDIEVLTTASHHMGNMIRSSRSESTKRTGNLTTDRGEQIQVVTVPTSSVSERRGSKGSDQMRKEQKISRQLEASALEISYDSFVEQSVQAKGSSDKAKELRTVDSEKLRRGDSDELIRVDSGDITVVHKNDSTPRRSSHHVNSSRQFIAESREDISALGSNDLTKATLNIWGNRSPLISNTGRSENGLGRKKDTDADAVRPSSSMFRRSRSASTGREKRNEHDMKRRQDSTMGILTSSSFGNEDGARRRQGTTVGLPKSNSFGNERILRTRHFNTAQTSTHLRNNAAGDTSMQLKSLRVSDGNNGPQCERPKHHMRKPVIVEDVSDEESSCAGVREDENFTQRSTRRHSVSQGKEPPVTYVKQSDCHVNADPPDVHSDDDESRSSYDTIVDEGLDDYLVAFNKVSESSPQGRERKMLRLPSERQEIEGPSYPSRKSHTSHSSSGAESGSPSSERKHNPTLTAQKNSGRRETDCHRCPSTLRSRPPQSASCVESRSPRSSTSKRNSTKVDGHISNSRDDLQHVGSSSQLSPEPNSPGQETVYSRQSSDSSQDSDKVFNKCDSQGRCIRHPHVQLRRKRRLGGWKKGKWKIIMMNCTECCFEEVQRLRLKNLLAKEQLLSSKDGESSASCSFTNDKDDTSATDSMTTASSTDYSKDNDRILKEGGDSNISFGSLESEGTASSAESSKDNGNIPKGILKKRHGEDSNFSFGSLESEGTTTFSYLSSLSASSSSAGFSSACSSSTASSYNKRPTGILRKKSGSKNSSKNSSRNSGSKNSSISSSRNSRTSVVVFAGRDHIINPVQFNI